MKKLIEAIKYWFNRAMTEPQINSRIVFLLHGVTVSLCVIVLTIGFMVSHNKEMYPTMVAAVGAGSVGTAAGRLLTKLGDKNKPAPPTEDSTSTTDANSENKEDSKNESSG